MIPVNSNIYLDRLHINDADTIVMYMADKKISNNISVIPYPYTIDDARWFLNDTAILEEETGIQKNYAIRNSSGLLLGIIGLHLNYPATARRSEFGYWLGKPHRNKGVMKAVLNRFFEVAHTIYGIDTLEAFVYHFNMPSMKLLLATSFAQTPEQQTRTRRDGTTVVALQFIRQIPHQKGI
ncbi:MAG TPA: GNAT family N-acetyltransferase [Chitinophagales bacterium]|nr:GNAT family N-acetyltransferase [Chitinophagales bacterium]